MRWHDLLGIVLQNLQRHRSRVFLTTLGVVIGCCSVVIMISMGIGMKEAQKQMLAQMGDLTLIQVSPLSQGKKAAQLTDQTIELFRQLDHVEAASAKLTSDAVELQLVTQNDQRYRSEYISIIGLSKEALPALGYQAKEGKPLLSAPFSILGGRYFAYSFTDSLRPESSNRIDLFSALYKEEKGSLPEPFFDPMKTPLTLTVISSDGHPLFTQKITVSGILEEDHGKYETFDGILMDIKDLQQLLDKANPGKSKKNTYTQAIVKVRGIEDVAAVEQKITHMGFRTSSMESIRKPMEKEAQQKQMMLGGLGAISLFVAALGIMNTMIMSITERTREIGIMKALGCRVRDIRTIFLTEAGLIGLLGGIIGCFLSLILSFLMNLTAAHQPGLLNQFQETPWIENTPAALSIIPFWLLLFAIVFSVLIGILSGFYPANRAVKISALEAIKSE